MLNRIYVPDVEIIENEIIENDSSEELHTRISPNS